MRLPRPMIAAVISLALVACDAGPSEPERPVVPAVIAADGPPRIGVTVDDGDLVVHITTWQVPCFEAHHAEVDVDATARLVIIRPFNQANPGVCSDELVEIPHAVRVSVAAPGQWTVRVIGAAWYLPQGETEMVVEQGAVIPIVIDNPAG